jgi:hypothetical protein
MDQGQHEYTINELWKMLEDNGEIHLLLTSSDDVVEIKKLLTRKKSKQNEKLRLGGIEPKQETLEFQISEVPNTSSVKLKCFLKSKELFFIPEIVIPSNDLS